MDVTRPYKIIGFGDIYRCHPTHTEPHPGGIKFNFRFLRGLPPETPATPSPATPDGRDVEGEDLGGGSAPGV